MLSIYSLNHCRISRNNTVVIAFGHRDHHWPRCPLLLAADLAALPSVCLVHATQTAAISDLERPVASIDRISFTVSRDTVIDRVGNVGVSAPTADRQTQAAPVLESGIAT